jgi:DNA-binding MarR family transcriptional regulator
MSAANRARAIARDCVAVRVRLVNRLVTGLYDAALRPHGLRASQLNLLVGVAAMGPVTPTALARRLVLDKSTLSRDIQHLTTAGWVATAPGADARSHTLSVTPAGLEAIDAAYPAWQAAQRDARAALGDVGVSAVAEVVNRLWAAQDAGG